jgi:carboxylate-amine ligase
VAEPAYGLFECYGVEIEYAIVDRTSLHVRPVADLLLAPGGGPPAAEVEHGELAWSNELVMHVLEMKTNGPAASLDGLARRFHAGVLDADAVLAPHEAMLLPTGMHPLMDPSSETRLWAHEYGEVYRTFDRVFDCRGHGWSNLQSTHLNLPFRGDAEFARLHAAVRALLPLVPALAASSPIVEGRAAPVLDARLDAYRRNAARVPSVTGAVVPEPVRDEAEYRDRILDRIYADLAPYDLDGVLRHEWVNARGAIARFERSSIEIRIIDSQECPTADLAVVAAICSIVRALTEEATAAIASLNALATERLAAILDACIRAADRAVIADADYLRCFDLPPRPAQARDVWRALLERYPPAGHDADAWAAALDTVLTNGTLARRILRRLSAAPPPDRIRDVYHALADCLREDALLAG